MVQIPNSFIWPHFFLVNGAFLRVTEDWKYGCDVILKIAPNLNNLIQIRLTEYYSFSHGLYHWHF